MAIDLDALSKADLQGLERAIAERERRLERERERRKAALAEVRAVAEMYGLPLESLVAEARSKKRSGGEGKGEGAAPRCRHPENPALTWTGRGRRPRWFLDAVAAGAAPEDMAIDRAA